MTWLNRCIAGLRHLFRSSRYEQEMDDELREYLETAAAHKAATGRTPVTGTHGGGTACGRRLPSPEWPLTLGRILRRCRTGASVRTTIHLDSFSGNAVRDEAGREILPRVRVRACRGTCIARRGDHQVLTAVDSIHGRRPAESAAHRARPQHRTGVGVISPDVAVAAEAENQTARGRQHTDPHLRDAGALDPFRRSRASSPRATCHLIAPVFRSYSHQLVNGGFIMMPMVPYALITYCAAGGTS